ncbi:MAG: threonine ammonia-lyase, biosynthetic [Deltaproteobacteria bacterium]|nr:threonine ammonia-lyase, biosynthetic [Deltaproteobacteria bacterium]
MDDLLRRALDARVGDVLPAPTPLDPAPILSARLGVPVLLKREDLTPVFSFKLRGAYNRMARLTAGERAAGVVAASAGNHAQGVAYAASRLGIDAQIVMPRTTPSLKVDAVRRLGAATELVGDSYAAAAERAAEIARDERRTLIPPFDDLDVIAGQGTIGLELLHQAPRDLEAVFVPVGGGGLAAGVAAVMKAVRPDLRVIGVEPDDSDAMGRSLAAGERVALDHIGIFADGVAVKQVGVHTFALCRQWLDGCLTVTIDEICAAIRDVFAETRTVLEPSGALSVAGLKRAVQARKVKTGALVAVTSGANMNFARLGYVAERAAVGEHREAILAVTIPERPGAFLRFCAALGPRNVTEFNYRLATRREAHVFVGVEIGDAAEGRALVDELERGGHACVDLSGDDVAKTHIRHMVGGRTPEVRDEVLYDFEFPERPGALLQFLTGLGSQWNISLFHYRNHGAAFGRVLCGLEVPPKERDELRVRLDGLGFSYTEATDNQAGRFFLR